MVRQVATIMGAKQDNLFLLSFIILLSSSVYDAELIRGVSVKFPDPRRMRPGSNPHYGRTRTKKRKKKAGINDGAMHSTEYCRYICITGYVISYTDGFIFKNRQDGLGKPTADARCKGDR